MLDSAQVGARGVDGSLELPLPSMNMLNKNEHATVLILLCWTICRDYVFPCFVMVLFKFADPLGSLKIDNINSIKLLNSTSAGLRKHQECCDFH
jgi:hypothetical protein